MREEEEVITKVKILGKMRELWGDGGNDDNWFLNQPKDIGELGIFCGCTLAQWRDPDFLRRISPLSKINQIEQVIRTLRKGKKNDQR